MNAITQKHISADAELKRKREQLASLEGHLADLELELTTIRTDLAWFWGRYQREVGFLYIALDEIEAQITAAEARFKRKDRKAVEREAWTQWARVKAEGFSSSHNNDWESKPRHHPTASLKKVFREVAKSIHPDLAIDEDERDLRQKLMAEANSAYRDGDETRLRAILTTWETTRRELEKKRVEPEVTRISRKIAQIEERLRTIDGELAQLKASDLYRLKVRVETAHKEGHDLLAEIAAELRQQIADAKQRLATVIARKGRQTTRATVSDR